MNIHIKKVISFGGGLQSSTMLLMSDAGELEHADLAIFADTQNELPETYEYIEFLKNKVTIPIITVSKGKLSDSILNEPDGYWIEIPFRGNRGGMGQRQCTERFKIRPIRKYLREHYPKNTKFEMWIGITTDEAIRMKDSDVKYIQNRFPLIEKMMNRFDCGNWLKNKGYHLPPKSACYFCPFHSDLHFKEMKNHPEWNTIVEIDRKLNKEGKFIHKSMLPIEKLTFQEEQYDLFGNECSGYCYL